ncbi:SurA N-terminal domain-containing protein [Xanthomonadaceae bacterium JHOS43]|nr:SurA N-terminal domain-containing protein [Xanthomonadaceae bacterium JHOS43]MCX7563962.1 SurA N-terminal domain-containing protein [Xanthomonadaceae bacterium XH05]
MLQTLREKTTGWVAVVILIVLAVPFAFFGVENYFQQQVPTYVAKVNDVEIGQDQFRERFEDYRNRMRQMLGDRYDAREFDTPIVKRQVLESLIDEEVLRQAAEKHGLVVSPDALQKEIAAIDAFHVNGRFDSEQYRLVLAGARMNPRIFESRMAKDLVTRALPRAVSATGLVTDMYVDGYLALRDQTRSFDYVLLPVPGDEQLGEITEEAIVAYYETHSALYQSQETVSVEYVELDGSKLEVAEAADETTLRDRYEESKGRYVEPEQRLVSHILIQTPANADAQTVQAAQARAAELAAKAREEGADFAALAREHSEDPGSKAMGGDLGWIERGVTDATFEEALFSMSPGVGDPVKGSDGWHVIWLREIQQESGKSFEQVRAELENEYLESERERAYSDAAGRLIDAIYRDPSTLDNAAAELGLAVQRAGPFSRAGGPGVFSNPDVVRAVFSDSVLVEGLVSDLIETRHGHGIALRVSQHVPAATRPLDEVRDQVTAAVRAERLAELGQAKLDEALAVIDSLDALKSYAEANALEVRTAESVGRTSATVDPAIAKASFGLPHPGEGGASIGSAHLIGGASAVIALTQVHDADLTKVDASQRDMLRGQLDQAIATLESTELIKALRREAKIDVVESRM